MRSIAATLSRLACMALALLALAGPTPSAASGAPALKGIPPVAGACPRYAQGSQIGTPPSLSSVNGVLAVSFSFQTTTDQQGRTLYCFMTPGGMQNPTLRVAPGDSLVVTVTNNTPQGINPMTIAPPNCGATQMTTSSVNIHYHGTNTSPLCGGDEVIKTLINSGQTFRYVLSIPKNEPPGLYWYHPHVHGISDAVVMGGATGVLVVEGMQSIQPAVAGLPEQIVVLRDQSALAGPNEGPGNCGIGVPFRDVTVNNVPVNSYQRSQRIVLFMPASLTVQPSQAQFWRVGNTAADSILDLQMVYDGVPQTLQIVAIDGVPVNSQDGTAGGRLVPVSHFRLPPASRVEFIVTTPAATVGVALGSGRGVLVGKTTTCGDGDGVGGAGDGDAPALIAVGLA